MRFLLTDEYWMLDALSPAEWHLVAELPSSAAGDAYSAKTRERLFPSPVSPEVLADEEILEQVEDWENFVQPDLADLFQDARKVVEKDIEGVETISPAELFEGDSVPEFLGELPELRRVRVPIENTEAWYSALNQARLLMNEEHDLAESEERLLARMEEAETIDEDRFLLIAQYELYSAVQVMLVENVMGM